MDGWIWVVCAESVDAANMPATAEATSEARNQQFVDFVIVSLLELFGSAPIRARGIRGVERDSQHPH